MARQWLLWKAGLRKAAHVIAIKKTVANPTWPLSSIHLPSTGAWPAR